MCEVSSSGNMFNQEQKQKFISYYLDMLDSHNVAKSTVHYKSMAMRNLFEDSGKNTEQKYQSDLSKFKYRTQFIDTVSHFLPSERYILETFSIARSYITWCYENHFIREQDLQMNPFMKDINWLEVVNVLTFTDFFFVKNAEHLVKILDHSFLPINQETIDTRLRCIYYAFYMGISSSLLNRALLSDIDLKYNSFLSIEIPEVFLPAFRCYKDMKGEFPRSNHSAIRLYKNPRAFIRTTSSKTSNVSEKSNGFASSFVSLNNSRLSDPQMKGISFSPKESNLLKNELFYQIAEKVQRNIFAYPNLYRMFSDLTKTAARSIIKSPGHSYYEFLFYLRMYYPETLNALASQSKLRNVSNNLLSE